MIPVTHHNLVVHHFVAVVVHLLQEKYKILCLDHIHRHQPEEGRYMTEVAVDKHHPLRTVRLSWD